MNKRGKGKLSTGFVTSVVMSIIVFLVILQVYSEVIPEAQTQGDSMNLSNRCTDVGCFYNMSRTGATDALGNYTCSATNTSSEDAVICADGLYNGIPLGGLLGSTGIVFIVIMAALLILVVTQMMGKGKK